MFWISFLRTGGDDHQHVGTVTYIFPTWMILRYPCRNLCVMVKIMERNVKGGVMVLLKIAAFWMPVAGIGGIVGAIETGTSPVNATIVFLMGCTVFATYIKAENIPCRGKKKSCRKERKMSGLEKDELQIRMRGMTVEEKTLVAKTLPDSILLEELCRRHMELREKVDNISRAVEEKGGAVHEI